MTLRYQWTVWRWSLSEYKRRKRAVQELRRELRAARIGDSGVVVRSVRRLALWFGKFRKRVADRRIAANG